MGNERKSSNAFKERMFKILTAALILIACKDGIGVQSQQITQPIRPPPLYVRAGTCSYMEMLSWEDTIQCLKLSYSDMLRELRQALNKRNSVNDPISLQLSKIQLSDVETPHPKLSITLFPVDVTVRKLMLIDWYVVGVEKSAFDIPQFTDLETLIFRDIKIPTLTAGMFNGLVKLQTLIINRPTLEAIESSALSSLQNLEIFELLYCGPHQLSIDNLFNTVMNHLRKIVVEQCVLTNTINEATFSGLANVRELSLIGNEIEHIGERSFDVVLKTLTVLNLSANRLTTISADLFKIEREGIANIDLGKNEWNCDCKLKDLRVFVIETKTYRFSGLKCFTPVQHTGKELLKYPDLCDIDQPALSVQLEPQQSPPSEWESQQASQSEQSQENLQNDQIEQDPQLEPLQTIHQQQQFEQSPQTPRFGQQTSPFGQPHQTPHFGKFANEQRKRRFNEFVKSKRFGKFTKPRKSNKFGGQIAQAGNCVNMDKMADKKTMCFSLTFNGMLRKLPQTLDKRDNSFKPINLYLSKIHFPKDIPILPKNWLSVDVSIKNLMLVDFSVTGIAENAFNSAPFGNMEMLSFGGTRIPTLTAGIFNGLNNLKSLSIFRPSLESIEKSALAPLQNLEIIRMRFCGPLLLSLDNLFDTVMPQLKKVDIVACNLANTINEATFTGLVSVQELKLNHNRIEHIGERSFNSILKTLTALSLVGNRLTTISVDLFKINTEGFVNIDLDNNPWNCDCNLEDLRVFIKEINTYRFNGLNCFTPVKYNREPLSICPDLCDSDQPALAFPLEPQQTSIAALVDEDIGEHEEDEDIEKDEENERETDGNDHDQFAGNVMIAEAQTPAESPMSPQSIRPTVEPAKHDEHDNEAKSAESDKPAEPRKPVSAASSSSKNEKGDQDPAKGKPNGAAIHATLAIGWIVLALTYLTFYHIF